MPGFDFSEQTLPTVISDGNWLRTSGGAAVWATNTWSGLSVVTGANQDLVLSPTYPYYELKVNPGGGSIRSITNPLIPGYRLSITVAPGASALTLKHNLAGGTGITMLLRGGADVVLNATEALDLTYDGANWVEVSRDQGVYQSFTPTWATSGTAPAFGNASVYGRYLQLGKMVHYTLGIQFGSTTTFGTGNFAFALPVTG